MRINLRLPLLACATALLLAGWAFAGVVTYSGFDDGSGSISTNPNSDAAAASFDAATGHLPIITFESSPLGPFSSLTVASGVTLTGADINGGDQNIINSPVCVPALCGYNTTSGGSQWLSLLGGSATFSFATPISAFGAYFTGVQVTGIDLLFNDGASQFVPIPVDFNNGGTAFVGFTDLGASIVSVEVNAQTTNYGDIIGVDDVRYGSSSTTPEPGSLVLLGSGVLGLAGLLRRKLT